MKKLKHVQLFEDFEGHKTPEALASEMISKASMDPEMSGWEFSIEPFDEGCFIIWENPADSEEWRDSGYAEDYNGDFSEVSPMAVLAIISSNGSLFAYPLSAEEKYYKAIVTVGDDEGEMLPVETYEDFKAALKHSLWNMD